MSSSHIKNCILALGGIALSIAFSLSSASAASLVTNGNFESGVYTEPPQSWEASASVGSYGQDWAGQYVVDPAFFPSTRLPSDSTLLYMSGTQNAWQGAWQQIGTFSLNTDYAFSTYAGVRWDFGYSGTVGIQLKVVKATQADLILGTVSQTFDIAPNGVGSANWYLLSGNYSYNAAHSAYDGGALWVTLTQTAGKTGGGGLGGLQANFDNVVVNSSAVPEPGTWALLAFGLCTVIFLRRRRTA
jgi:hypothetical protein